MKSETIIRPAEKSDVDLILTLIQELALYEKLAHQAVATPELLAQHLFGASACAEVVIAEHQDKTAGFALFFQNFSTFLGRPGLYLEDLYVRESHRGLGIGKAVLSYLATIALERNYGRIEWSVLDWNRPSIGFYQRIGAKAMDEWTTFRLSGEAITTLANQKD